MRELWYAFDALGEDESPDEKKKKQLQKLISGHVIQRADYLAQVLFVWIVQMGLCVILTTEIVLQSAETLSTYPQTFWVIISRFVCAIVLHM